MIPRGDGWREGCHPHPLLHPHADTLEYPLCDCERSGAISSPEQRRLFDVCSTSSRLPRRYALRSKKVDTHEHPGSLEYPSCHCERSAAISSPEQRRLVDVCSTSSRLARRYAPRDVCSTSSRLARRYAPRDVCSTSSRLARRYAPRNDKGGTLGHPGRPSHIEGEGVWSSPPGQRGIVWTGWFRR